MTGFYVANVVSRYWDQFLALPWTDRHAYKLVCFLPGQVSASYIFLEQTFIMPFSERHFSAILRLVILLSVFDIQSPTLTFLLPGVNPMKGACMLVLQVLLKSLVVTSVVKFNQVT